MSPRHFAPLLSPAATLSGMALGLAALAFPVGVRAEIHGASIPATSPTTVTPAPSAITPADPTQPDAPAAGGVTLPPDVTSPASTSDSTTTVVPMAPSPVATGNKADLNQIHQNAQQSLGVVVVVVALSDMPPGSTMLKDLHEIKDNQRLSSTYYLDGAVTAIFGKIKIVLEKIFQIDGNEHTSYDGIDFTLDPDGAQARSDAGGSIPVPGMAFTDAGGTVHDYSLPDDYDAFKQQLRQPVSSQ